MIISVLNHTTGQLTDEEVQHAIRAINRQIAEDFAPYWGMEAKLRLEGKSSQTPDEQELIDMRGDAVLYLWDRVDVLGALGYHYRNFRGIPYGFVFTEIAQAMGESWTVTLSHEALEMIADPDVNLLAMGPHPDPAKSDTSVFYFYEMCDAVQAEIYTIDGVEVSNFVLPLYFTGSEEFGGRNDFLGRSHDGRALKSFGINPGGYVAFFNPVIGQYDTFYMRADHVAKKRLEIKQRARETRRINRYQRSFARGKDDTKS